MNGIAAVVLLTGALITAIGITLLAYVIERRRRGQETPARTGWTGVVIAMTGWMLIGVGDILAEEPVLGALTLAMNAWMLITIWRRRRKDRRKVAALISEKGRMIRARLVRELRARTRQRPVLKPGRIPA